MQRDFIVGTCLLYKGGGGIGGGGGAGFLKFFQKRVGVQISKIKGLVK